jgi:hypothetical protein
MIYFLRAEQHSQFLIPGYIKIGTTTRLSVRLKQIAAEIGHTPTVLAVLDGAFAEEAALHVRFESARKYGEWFEPCDELLRLIETEGRPWDGVDEVPYTLHSVKVDRAVIDRLRMVALHKKTTLNELLTELLRVPADKLHSQMVRELEGKG